MILGLSAVTMTGQSSDGLRDFHNTALSPEARAKSLVSQMTLEEKVGQMGSGAAAIPRLGIPAYNYWNEGLHGVARAGYATMFPQAIGMAATWDDALLGRVGDVISTEARAKNNVYEAEHNNDRVIWYGVNFFAPNINLFTHTRWVRSTYPHSNDILS